MLKSKKSYKVISLNWVNISLNTQVFFKLRKSSIQLPFASIRRQPRQEKNLSLKSKKADSLNSKQTKKHLSKPKWWILPRLPHEIRSNNPQITRLKLLPLRIVNKLHHSRIIKLHLVHNDILKIPRQKRMEIKSDGTTSQFVSIKKDDPRL